ILRGETVIIFDPKGDKDLRDAARSTCIAVGRPEAYHYFHPGFPSQSVRIDPLRNFNRSTGLASRIATMVAPDSKLDAFSSFSQSALNKDIQALLMLSEKPNLVQLRRYFETGTESLVVNVTRHHLQKILGPDWEETRFPPYRSKIKDPSEAEYA